jgi:hydroxymethylglutaryl-CoA lyase
MLNQIQIVEVGPRDGLQNEVTQIPTDLKVAWIDRLSQVGYREIEITSFVNPRWIPQLADAKDVATRIQRIPGVRYSALVPNEKGLQSALETNVDGINVFMSASETHNRKNINKSIAETFPVLAPVIRQAKQAGKHVRGYISTVFGCPYEGNVAVEQVLRVLDFLLTEGVDEVSLGDTIGVAVPTQVEDVLQSLLKYVDAAKLALHFHDTRGTALANAYAGWQMGIRTFDASLGGLGGCPYAPGASGNVATEDMHYMFSRMGIQTGLAEPLMLEAATFLEQAVGKPMASHGMAVHRSVCKNEVDA